MEETKKWICLDEKIISFHKKTLTSSYYWYDPRNGLYLTDMKSKVSFSAPSQGD